MANVTVSADIHAMMQAADASAARTALGIGSIATQAASAVAITGGTITGIGTPTSASDVAIKSYVDGLVNGLNWKAPVVTATTANGTLATAFANGQSVGGVTVATGDRILLKNQSSQTENGIYIVAASGAPTRATDADSGTELDSAAVFVLGGTNQNLAYVMTTAGTITVGASNIVWTLFGSQLGACLTANNLSDVTASTARSNLGLGTGALDPAVNLYQTAWLDATNGNNGTAAVGTPTKPYTTLQAAYDAGARHFFLAPGSYGTLNATGNLTLSFKGCGRGVSNITDINSTDGGDITINGGGQSVTIANINSQPPAEANGGSIALTGVHVTGAVASIGNSGNTGNPGGTGGSGGTVSLYYSECEYIYSHGGAGGAGAAGSESNGGDGGVGGTGGSVTLWHSNVAQSVLINGGTGGAGGAADSAGDPMNGGNGADGGGGGQFNAYNSRAAGVDVSAGVGGGYGSGVNGGSDGSSGANAVVGDMYLEHSWIGTVTSDNCNTGQQWSIESYFAWIGSIGDSTYLTTGSIKASHVNSTAYFS